MENFSTPATAEVAGLYLNKYEEIVKSNRRFLIPNYFIHYWVSRLGPKLSWLVIALQQACWRADDDQCAIAQTILADEIGVERHTISRILNDNPLRAWYIPEIEDQPGEINRADDTYQPLPRRYTVYLSTPLIPEHLAGLYSYFRQSCPNGEVEAVETAVDHLINLKSKEALALLEAVAPASDRQFHRPRNAAEIVFLATGLNLSNLSEPVAERLGYKLSALDLHLTEIGHTVCRQYFRSRWVPRLGAPLAWLVMALRSHCYYNPKTGELRDTGTWTKSELVAVLGQSTDNLRKNLLPHPDAGHFFQVLETKRHKVTFRVSMVSEPLTTENAADYWARQSRNPDKSTITPSSNPDKSTITPSSNPDKSTITLPSNPDKSTTTPAETRTNLPSPPSNPDKSTLYKYYKDSVLKQSVPDVVENSINGVAPSDSKDLIDLGSGVSVQETQINSSERNKPFEGNGNQQRSELEEILAAAGLSGTGLIRLCGREPPLDLRLVRAVILYAEAQGLGPGYIYNHLSRGAPVEPFYLRLAGLDSDTLALFRQAVRKLQVNGTLAPGVKTHIPPDLLNFFIRFAEAFAGLEATAVRVALSREDVSAADPALEPASGELDRLWFQALDQLQTQMTRQTFDTRLRDTRLIARAGSDFTVAVKNTYAADWLEHRLLPVIQRVLAGLIGERGKTEPSSLTIKFVVADG